MWHVGMLVVFTITYIYTYGYVGRILPSSVHYSVFIRIFICSGSGLAKRLWGLVILQRVKNKQ